MLHQTVIAVKTSIIKVLNFTLKPGTVLKWIIYMWMESFP